MEAEKRRLASRDYSAEEAGMMRKAVIAFALRALRPLVRTLMRLGLSYPELNQVCRWLCVDIAMAEKEFFVPRRRRQFKARVACLTALSRKEVLRLYSSARPDLNDALQSSNRAARVLEGWLNDETYLGKDGEPLEIPFRSGTGRRSFSSLVSAYSGDIPPRAILDELLRAGCCEMVSEDEIRVRHKVYVMRPIDVEQVEEAARVAARALAEVDQMLAANPTSELPRAVREDAEIEANRLHLVQ
ncbi:MAG: DUF6502 family protein [Gammaproteobacteria bacterium]|nr:DUF6502 family protein [Gammaproteobacteria bacterium]